MCTGRVFSSCGGPTYHFPILLFCLFCRSIPIIFNSHQMSWPGAEIIVRRQDPNFLRMEPLLQNTQEAQGDHIGRIFAQWVNAYFGHFLKITEVSRILGLLYLTFKFMH
jgi:hypothetical protein